MDDLISRKAAIDDVLQRLDSLKGLSFGTSTFRDGLADGYARIMSDLQSLPSVQPDKDMIHLQKEQAYMQGWEDGREALRENTHPEIIRCKDCKWKQGSECVRFADVRPFPDDFCSRAERRKDA